MKDKAKDLLFKKFLEYQYIRSIYLWGSITTNEFDSEESDIDSIGIVDEETSISEKQIINQSLSEEIPQLKINFIYMSELDGGQIKESLARVIPVECLLYDMPFWIHVAGTNYKKEDFVLGRVSIETVIESQIKKIKDRYLPRPEKSSYAYFGKALSRLCYFIHQIKDKPKPFTYSDLLNDSTDLTHDICNNLVEAKRRKWNTDYIEANLEILLGFMNMCISRGWS
jgi:predicted nucleotidyltransferase